MKEEFDFNKVGKKMPYQVPSDFFENVTETTLAEAKARAAGEKKHSVPFLWTLSVAASVALLLVAGYFFYTGSKASEAMVAGTVSSKTTIAAEPQVAAEHVLPDTMTIPGSTAPERSVSAKADIAKVAEPLQKQQETKQLAKVDKEATFEEILRSLPDEELLQLAELAETDLYVYEETLSDE